MTSTVTALIMCGEYDRSPDEFQYVACLSPLRHYKLKKCGQAAVRLFDYSLSEEQGANLDQQLQKQVETCLCREGEANGALRWAPLAYQHVLWRLSRYICLKGCVERFLAETGATKLVVSSSEDSDLADAARALADVGGLEVEFGNGSKDNLGSVNYCIEPSFIPRAVDPSIVVLLHLLWLRLRIGTRKILFDGFISRETCQGVLRPFKYRRWVDFLGAVADKVLMRNSSRLVRITPNLDRNVPQHLKADDWHRCFRNDEVNVANAAISTFSALYPSTLLDRVVAHYISALRFLSPEALILSHDQSDFSRCISYAAHRAQVPVVYLPHGLVLEDYSGYFQGSEFCPDGVLAWSEKSAQTFSQRGWPAHVVGYNRYRRAIQPFRPMDKNWRKLNVLVLMSEWVGITTAGREDCSANDLIEIGDCLHQLGIVASNITLKFHHGPDGAKQAKRMLISEYMGVTGYQYQVADVSEDSFSLIGKSDLVISMLTTGIYEAIMQGIPVVVFGMSFDRVGTLAGSHIPFARNREELKTVLREYDNSKVAIAYKEVSTALQCGGGIEDSAQELVGTYLNHGQGSE